MRHHSSDVCCRGDTVAKVESCNGLNFGENLKRKKIDDSHSLSCVTEVAYEFSVRRQGPSDPYTKTAPAARGIFDHLCKTTFATVSRIERTCCSVGPTSAFGHTSPPSDCLRHLRIVPPEAVVNSQWYEIIRV
jgi:hypothetical protein